MTDVYRPRFSVVDFPIIWLACNGVLLALDLTFAHFICKLVLLG